MQDTTQSESEVISKSEVRVRVKTDRNFDKSRTQQIVMNVISLSGQLEGNKHMVLISHG
jgi:hypothetical protein